MQRHVALRRPGLAGRSLIPSAPWERRRVRALDAALVQAGAKLATPPLATLGDTLRSASLGPSAAFTEALRLDLLSAARRASEVGQALDGATSFSLGAARLHSRRAVGARISASLAAASVIVVGVGTASAHALPGDTLYGLKRHAESVQLDLTTGDQARGLLRLQFASTRLSEIHGLVARARHGSVRPSPASLPGNVRSAIASTLVAMNTDTDTGASLLTSAFLARRQTGTLSKLVAFTRTQENSLGEVLPALSGAEAITSLAVLHTVAARTSALLADAPVAPEAAPSTPGATTAPTASPSADQTPAAPGAPVVPPVSQTPPAVTASPAGTPTPTQTAPSPTSSPADPPTPESSATASAGPSATDPSSQPTQPSTASPTPSQTSTAGTAPGGTSSGASSSTSTDTATGVGAAPAYVHDTPTSVAPAPESSDGGDAP